MIYLYTGTPGSGKSLHVVRDIQKWVSLYSSPVIGNFDINIEIARQKGDGGYLYLDNDTLCPDLLIWFSNKYRLHKRMNHLKEDTILLIIDECQLIFNARTWNEAGRKEWISFFTQHRKYGYRVILVCQYAEMIDKQVRNIIEYEIIHRKVSNIGIGGKIINILSFGGLHVAVKRYAPLKQKVGQEFFKGSRYLFALYDTFNTFNGTKAEDSGTVGVDPVRIRDGSSRIFGTGEKKELASLS